MIKFRSMTVGAHKEKENLGCMDKTDFLMHIERPKYLFSQEMIYFTPARIAKIS